MNRVFVLGNATVDIVQQVDNFPHPGETVLAGKSLRCAGGKGLNQAVAAARTGANVTLVAPVGRDSDSAFLAESVAGEEGLRVDWLACPAGTDLSVIWINGSGENVIVSSADCARWLQPDQVRDLCRVLQPGDYLVLQGNLSLVATRAAAEVARACGARTILNTAPIAWDMATVMRLADILIANEGEAGVLSQAAKDPAKAVTLYEKACRAGNSHGCYNLGIAYDDGDVVAKDPVKAATYYVQSCTAGDPHGCHNAAIDYEDGIGVAKDQSKALALYEKACDGGDVHGCYNFGVSLDQGNGIAQDVTAAAALFGKACDGGDGHGCYNLGIDYDQGTGVGKDSAKAAMLYEKSCAAGDMQGCFNLAVDYQNGDGVSRDPAKSNSLREQACKGGLEKACR